ncbi:MAG: pyruvate kinase, partial [Rhodospirillales bacterium]|nr:pyruvate kinase [Rhodospirillales bacterium]
MDRPETLKKINRLIDSVTALRAQCLAHEKAHADAADAAAPGYRDSARNLLHYLALRQHDLRGLQEELSSLGLSSLGRLEAHTMATLNAVLKTLHRLADRPSPDIDDGDTPVDFVSGPAALREHAERLLGPEPAKHPVRIMVTMPTQAASDPALIRDLMKAGMNILRINCAHDGPDAWAAMVTNLREAERELGTTCRVLADLSGPKLRTGPLAQADHVVKLRPHRNHKGDVITRARIWLTPETEPAEPPFGATGQLLIRGDLLNQARPGYTIEIEERRGRERILTVTDIDAGSCWTVSDRTLYVEEGAALILRDEEGQAVASGQVGSVPPIIQPLLLQRGDMLVLTRAAEPGKPCVRNQDGRTIEPARISCSLPAVFRSVKPGAEVWMDDGAIAGIVHAVSEDEITLEVTYARPGGSKLRGEKGI